MSAVLLGRYRLALDLLEQVEAVPRLREALAEEGGPGYHALVARLGLGQYEDVLALTSDISSHDRSASVRAQAAIELGEDEIAKQLLTTPLRDEQEIANQLRMLGDLRIRRGDRDTGRRLVRDAMEKHANSAVPESEVDRGYCLHHLAEASFAEGDLDVADALATDAAEAIGWAPTNHPGLAVSKILASRIAAAAGDLSVAHTYLSGARDEVDRCDEAPPLSAALAWAEGEVAVAERNTTLARQHLGRALAIFESIGAMPHAQEVAGRLDALE